MIKIPPIYNAEDGAIIPVLLSLASKITYVRKPLYNYLYRKNSLSSSQNLKIVYSFCEASVFLKQHTPPLFEEEFLFRRIQIMLYSVILKGLQGNMNIKELKGIVDNFKQEVPLWYCNKYLHSLPLRKKLFFKAVRYNMYSLLRLYSSLHCYLLN